MSEKDKIKSEEIKKFQQIKKANNMFELAKNTVKNNEDKKEKNNCDKER